MMPSFILLCRDKEDGLDLRKATRETHLAYVKGAADRILLAGPLLSDADEPEGSLLIITADNRDDAKSFADNDPYALAGLFESVEIRQFRIVTGALAQKSD